MKFAPAFAPHDDIADLLLTEISGQTDDGSHDLSHILRVWRNVQVLMAQEGGCARILTAATLLHDCVEVAKDSPQRAMASGLAAQRAREILAGLAWADADIAAVAHAIEAHSFSANVTPETLEAKILQDADRLDAIGHIGIARCFYVSGRLNRAMYDLQDPDATDRPLDDAAFGIDHFKTKLLRLAGSFQTETGTRLAASRHATVRAFLDGFLHEVTLAP